MLQRLHQAGVNLNSAEGQAIRQKVAELYQLKAAQEATAKSAEQLKQAREEWAEAGAEATKGIVADLRAGKSLSDAFASALDRLTQKLLDAAIDQAFAGMFGTGSTAGGGLLSGIGSLVSGLFGGARAKGGPVRGGKAYLVGEEGPELFSPGQGGSIVPHGRTAAMLAAPPELPAMPAVSAAPVVKVSNPAPSFKIENHAPVDFERKTRTGENGERQEVIVIREKVAEAFGRRGATTDAFESRYPANRSAVPKR